MQDGMDSRTQGYLTNQVDKKKNVANGGMWRCEVSSAGNKGGIILPGQLVASLKSEVT